MGMQHYYYEEQFRRYLTQFMAIFAGMKVMVGHRDEDGPKLINVPVHYGNKDRVVAHILGENTQNKPLQLPIMSANIIGIDMAPELRKGVGQERRNTYLPRGEAFPDGLTTIHQLMPIPYRVRTELAIYTSNTDQRFQILEQIMMLFDPIVQIQTSDSTFDWTKLTTVELEAISLDDNYPVGTDRRIMVSTLSFHFPVYITAPTDVRDDYIKDIFVRIGAVSSSAATGDEMVAELDAQGIEYEQWFSLDDINLP